MLTTIFSTTLPNPSPDESQALAVAASYLKRAGTTAATQMLRLTPTPEQMAELRKADQATREPWDRNRRQNRMGDAYRKQREFIVEDMRRVSRSPARLLSICRHFAVPDAMMYLRAGHP